MKNYKAELQEMEAHTGPCFASNCEKMHLTPDTIDKILSLIREVVQEATKKKDLEKLTFVYFEDEEGNKEKVNPRERVVYGIGYNKACSEILSNVEKLLK